MCFKTFSAELGMHLTLGIQLLFWCVELILSFILYLQLYGETRQTRSRPRQKLFYQLPHRLAFSLDEVAPASALAAGSVCFTCS